MQHARLVHRLRSNPSLTRFITTMGNLLSRRARQPGEAKDDSSSKADATNVKLNTSQSKPTPSSKHDGDASPTATSSPTTPLDGEALPGALASTQESSKFVLLDKSVDEPRPFKVVCIGAGFSGIMCGIRYALALYLVAFDSDKS